MSVSREPAPVRRELASRLAHVIGSSGVGELEAGSIRRPLSIVSARIAELQSHQRELVALARANGETWGVIGDLLGMTRQAAQQRFAGPPA